eukprot:5870490-Pleurochrysis_carterae.AAC.1
MEISDSSGEQCRNACRSLTRVFCRELLLPTGRLECVWPHAHGRTRPERLPQRPERLPQRQFVMIVLTSAGISFPALAQRDTSAMHACRFWPREYSTRSCALASRSCTIE